MRRNYSKVIDELRNGYGLNLVAIGQRIGTDPRTVGKWQQGKHQPNQESRKKLNKLYREVRNDMTTQVSIFEEVNENGRYLQVIHTDNFHGHQLDVYGDFENPLFMAREVAEMIEYSKTSQGYYDVQSMLRKVDEDEKIKGIPLEGTTETFRSGQTMWFLTEYGLYEVLMRSSKPKAKEFRKAVKNILKEIRTQGYYMQGELIQPTLKAPSNLAEAERYYIDCLAQSIAEAQDMAEKGRLTDKLTAFVDSIRG
ncbi:TPA: BRO-like protein [Streptococcus suis]|nr:BRO-like protein [Streptococcus suis]